jgi:DNA-binding transcriptional LysR family regulator
MDGTIGPRVSPDDLLLFARVMEAGSFTAAAQRLGWPKSTVSRRLSMLEAAVGERVLQRTTRKLQLTDFGAGLLEHARGVAAELDEALAYASHRQAEPSGRLRVSMPSDVATVLFGDALARFVLQHPKLTLELDLSPRRVDLIGENFDLAVRMGELRDEGPLAARRIGAFAGGLYASPDWLAARAPMVHPDALLGEHGLMVRTQGGEPMPWELVHRDGGAPWQGVPQRLTLVNLPAMLLQLAAQGAGVAAASHVYADAWVRQGRLVRLFPDWDAPPASAWALFPERRLMPARTRLLIDALVEEAGRRCAQCTERGHPA